MAQVLFLAPARKTFLPSTTNLELFSNCKEHYKMFVKKPQHWQKIVNTEQKNHSVWLFHSPLLRLIVLRNWFWKWKLQSTILHFQKQYQRTSQQCFWRWHDNGCGHNLWDITHGVSDNYHETATIIVMLSRWSKQIHYRSQFKVEVYLGLVA